MKILILTLLGLIPVSAFASKRVELQCRSGGNNAYSIVLDVESQMLRMTMYSQIDYGAYPQVDSSNQGILTFFKRPDSKNNGIPIMIEIPADVIDAGDYTSFAVNVKVSQNYPGPIDENVFYTNRLECTKVRGFVF